MQFKSYATKAKVPQRMSRKRARQDVFIFNKKMAKLRRKAERLKRKSLEQSEE